MLKKIKMVSILSSENGTRILLYAFTILIYANVIIFGSCKKVIAVIV